MRSVSRHFYLRCRPSPPCAFSSSSDATSPLPPPALSSPAVSSRRFSLSLRTIMQPNALSRCSASSASHQQPHGASLVLLEPFSCAADEQNVFKPPLSLFNSTESYQLQRRPFLFSLSLNHDYMRNGLNLTIFTARSCADIWRVSSLLRRQCASRRAEVILKI
jgi:hypothetical protein